MQNKLILSDEEYYSIKDRLSASGIKYMDDCPAMYKSYIENGIEKTTAMSQGSYVHAFTLEPNKIDTHYAYLKKELLPFPELDFRNAENKKFRNEWVELNKHKIVLTREEDYKEVVNGVNAISNNKVVQALLKGADFEVPFLWEQPETGALMRGKADIVNWNKRFVADIKKMPNLNPKYVQSEVFKRYIHTQAVCYLEMCSIMSGEQFEDFFIIGVDLANGICQVFRLDFGVLEKGKETYLKVCEEYKKCVDTGVWSDYSKYSQDKTGIIELGVPNWAYYNEFN